MLYPFEYYTGGTYVIDGPVSGIFNGENCEELGGGDQGDYWSCLLVNATMNSDIGPTDLYEWPNNVGGEEDLTTLSSGSGSGAVGTLMARIFHPIIKGHTAYTDPILAVYRNSATGNPIGVGTVTQVDPTATPTNANGDTGGIWRGDNGGIQTGGRTMEEYRPTLLEG